METNRFDRHHFAKVVICVYMDDEITRISGIKMPF